MDKKLVYVLVTKESDHYTEMALLSTQCARKYSSGITIELVIDRKSYDGLKGHRSTIKEHVDNIHVIDIEAESNALISRILKTKLRQYITGDYLYIDIDAVPITNLDSVFNTPCDIAMAYDLEKSSDMVNFIDPDGKIYSENNWILSKRFFNSGVMLVRDSEKTHAFFDSWHSKWQEYVSITGLHLDQPSLNHLIETSDLNITELDPEWNVCIGRSTKARGVKAPKIYHYFTIRFETRNDTHFINIVKNIKQKQTIDWELIENIRRSKYPWTNKESIKLNWITGKYIQATKLGLSKVFKG